MEQVQHTTGTSDRRMGWAVTPTCLLLLALGAHTDLLLTPPPRHPPGDLHPATRKAIGASSPRDVVCEVSALTEFGWSEHRANKVQQHGAAVREVTETVLVTVDGAFQQNVAKFVEWAAATFSYAEGSSDWGAVAKSAYDAFLADPNVSRFEMHVPRCIGSQRRHQRRARALPD